jgi:hypothetical protein
MTELLVLAGLILLVGSIVHQVSKDIYIVDDDEEYNEYIRDYEDDEEW